MARDMDGFGEQYALPAPNNGGSLCAVIQPQDLLVSSPAPGGPLAKVVGKSLSLAIVDIQWQDSRRRLDKLSIPAIPICIPESSSPCVQSPCESIFPPFPDSMYDPEGPPFRTRNIIVFGESGVGKSSVINMIAGKHITQTSNDAVGCTFQNQCYQVPIDGLNVNLWDTAGLDEGTEGTVPARQAENSLKAFLRQITRWNGIDLLLYCVRGTRVRQALLRNYNIFYGAICRKKVPVALVVTGLENYEGDMETWWMEHEKDLIKHGMRFDAHACVTTIRNSHPAIQGRLKESQEVLRNLVRTKFDTTTWRADEDSLMTTSLPDVRALLQAAEKRAAPLIIICDATQPPNNQIYLFPPILGSRLTCTSDREHKCLYVDARDLLLGGSKPWAGTVQRPDLLIFYADAESDPNLTWTTFEQFHVSCGGEMCPVIVVFRGLDNHAAAAERWRLVSSSHGGTMIANPTYHPGLNASRELVERADAALAALVEAKCLIKFEEKQKLSRFQRFCRRRFFINGRM